MVLKLDLGAITDSISLAEFIACLDDCSFDPECRESLIDVAPQFRRLGNNQTFLADAILAELKDLMNFQVRNVYGPTVFLLHTCEKYFLRANVWKPISALEAGILGFRYDICHDHNFDILTIGYSGPGYRARTYEYDHENIEGTLGEIVDITPTGTVTLARGDVMLYRAKKDIHIQLPPESLSVSLNVIPRNSWIERPQYQFDEERRQIVRYLHNSGTELVIRMAGALGSQEAADWLDEIRQGHHSPHIRALAAVSEIALAPGRAETIDRWLAESTPVEKFIYARETTFPGACLKSLGMT